MGNHIVTRLLSASACDLLFGFLAVIFAFAVITMLVALRDGSFLRSSHQNKMIFRKPLSQRLFAASLAFLVGVGGPISYWYSFMDATGSESEITRITFWAVFAVLCLVVGILLLWLFGPEELSLDLNQRTYHLVSGWPLVPTARSGDCSDIAGIYVRSTGKGNVFIGASWRYSKKRFTPLGRFSRERPAKQFAQDIAFKLELPQIDVQT